MMKRKKEARRKGKKGGGETVKKMKQLTLNAPVHAEA
jgi:hypothetical protein